MLLAVLIRHGIKVPHFCYHPGLSVAGVCRLCLVEVEGSRKLEISCSLPVREGMVVNTESPKVHAGREFVMEFTLINHPLDCPECDQAGECWLQEFYMGHDRKESEFVENKVHKDKRKVIGDRVILDQERCILCTRCVRFCDEVTKTHELGIWNRGDQSVLDVAPGQILDNPYSENVVDICPVGALTSRDFRFDGRVWFLKEADSICPGCAKGCNIVLHHRDNRIRRILPRHNEKVNGYWMCDAGRDVYQWVHAENRLTKPHMKDGQQVRVATWPEAFGKAVGLMASFLQSTPHRSKQAEPEVAGMASVRCAQEDNQALCEFLVRTFGASFVTGEDVTPKTWPHDTLLRQEDCNPNTRGAMEVVKKNLSGSLRQLDIPTWLEKIEKGLIRGLVVLNQDLMDTKDLVLKKRLEKALPKLSFLILFCTHQSETAALASVVFPMTTFAEQSGSFTNVDGITQCFSAAIEPLGEAVRVERVFSSLAEAVEKDASVKASSSWESPREMSWANTR